MKHIIASLVLTLASTTVLAHDGSHTLVCKSASKSGSAQVVEISLKRENSVGLVNPTISITVDGKKIVMSTPDLMKSYGATFHNSPLGVITVTADNERESKASVYGFLSVVAVPSSVQAFDTDGKVSKWTFEAEKDECNDSNGTAKFQGVFHGYINVNKKSIDLDTQILDCELTYDSGMAC